MSRQSKTKHHVTLGLFVILVASIGFPFQSLPLYTEFEVTSDYQLVNFLMGKGLTGEYYLSNTLYDMASYYVLNSIGAIPKAEAILPEAEAQEPSYPVITRGSTYETIQLDKHNFTSKVGLPEYIERFDGVFVPYEYWEDANAVTFNSGDLSFVFDKNTCAYTIYNDGRIFNNSTEIIKSDTWVVKFAENGTDNWADVPQQSLGCLTEVYDFEDEDTFQIIYTKQDSNGIIEHMMNKTVATGMKHIVSYTNNNPAWNNTKIAFSHILQGTPEHMSILTGQLINNTAFYEVEKYSTNSTSGVPDTMANNSTMIDDQNPVDIPYTELLVNGTMIDDGFDFHFTNEEKKQIHYDFDQGLDKLWNVKFLEEIQGNQTSTKVYLDYMNDPPVLAVGNTTTIDPIVTATSPTVRQLTLSSTTFGQNCGNNGLGCAGTTITAGTGTFFHATNVLRVPFVTYNITAIPTNADVQQVRLSHGGTSIFESISKSTTSANIYSANGEDFSTLTPQELSDCFYTSPLPWGEVNPHDGAINTNGGSGSEDNDGRIGLGNPTMNPCGIRHVAGLDSPATPNNDAFTFNSGTDIIVQDGTGELSTDLESRFLQLGLTQYTYMLCDFRDEQHKISGGTTASFRTHGNVACATDVGTGVTPTGAWASGGTIPITDLAADKTMSFDPLNANTFLEVTYKILTQASAPLSLTCNPTGSTSVDLDWFPPSDLGGASFVDGYRIERDSGGGFTNLVADTGSALTFHTDNTVTAGTTFKYRVSALTGFGQGQLSSEVSCGVAGVSDQVTDLTAQNQALGVIALDWTEPSFTGNVAITGYRVDRTQGTPNTDNEWQFIQHKREATDTNTRSTGVVILNIGDDLGGYRIQGISNALKEGIRLTTHDSISTGIGHTYLFKDFAVDDLKNRVVEFSWEQFKTPAGFSLQTFGDWETRAWIADGVYDMTGANTVGGAGDFPAQVAGTFTPSMHVPSVGNGIIYDCMDLTNVTVLEGGNPTDTTLPTTGQMESANQHTVQCNLDDLSSASQNRVTVVFQLYDNQAGLQGCGSNCASSGSGGVNMDYIDIEGLGHWDFTDDLPVDTDINFDPPSVSSPLPMKNVVGNFGIGNFTIGDGFITLVADTGNTNVEFLDNTVEESTDYGYRVFALNSEGSSPSSNIALVTTAGAPLSPEPITVTPTGTQTINISWNDADLNGGTLVGYEIERKTGVGGIFGFLDSTTSTTFDDGQGLFTLVPATEYCYKVKTVTNVGESTFTTEQCATTFDAPSEVENLIVTAIDGSSVNMQFDTPLSDGGSPITGFKVERQIGGAGFITLEALTLDQTRNDTGLPIGTLIEYRVSASNQFGFGNTLTVGDTTDTTPQVPQNLVCSAGTPDTITLNWDTPNTFSPPTGYQISRNIDGGAFVVYVADTASTSTIYNDTPLLLDTVYGYKILAHTAEGDTLETPEIFCQTLKKPDIPPENFKANFSLLAPHDVTLSWDTPNTFGIPIDSITVERDDGAGYVEIAVLPSNAVGMVDSEPDNDIQQKYRIKMTNTLGDSDYGYALPSDLNRISHFDFSKTVEDTGDEKNSASVIGVANFIEQGHGGENAFDYDGASYITVDIAQESDYDFDRLDEFGATLYYSGGGVTLPLTSDEWGAFEYKEHPAVNPNMSFSQNSENFVIAMPSTSNTRGNGFIFKTFEASYLDGQSIVIQSSASFPTGSTTRAWILDGNYTLANHATDFGVQSSGVSPNNYPPLKSSGLLETATAGFNGNTEIFTNIDTSSATDPSGLVTVVINYQDVNTSTVSGSMSIDYVDIKNVQRWDFGTTPSSVFTDQAVALSCPYDCGILNANTFAVSDPQALISKSTGITGQGWVFYLENGKPTFRMNGATQSLIAQSDIEVSNGNLQFLGFTHNGNSTVAGVDIIVNGTITGKTSLQDNLTSESILNNLALTFGATSDGLFILQSITDNIMIFGENLDDGEIEEITEDEIETIAPINATMTLTGTTFADISSEEPTINLISGFPLPNISGNLELKNFTTTTVNTASGLSMPASGVLNVPALFNQMGSTSNYTAIATLDNGLEAFVVISNEDIQNPLFTLPNGIEFFFQQQRINNFEDLSFNFTKTSIPFDLACNLKSELFEDGVTYEFENVGFLQEVFDVPRTKDVVVACIDQNSPLLNPDEPSFGGSNALLTFVSFGDTTGIGAFLNFTDNYGDFFGAPLPYLFIILAAALFTGRSAPTGIIVIGIALGIMWYLGILVVDPVLWGIIVVLIILGAIGGKKFL